MVIDDDDVGASMVDLHPFQGHGRVHGFSMLMQRVLGRFFAAFGNQPLLFVQSIDTTGDAGTGRYLKVLRGNAPLVLIYEPDSNLTVYIVNGPLLTYKVKGLDDVLDNRIYLRF